MDFFCQVIFPLYIVIHGKGGKKKASPKFKKKLLNEEDLQAVNESVCIHRTLINAFRDYFVLRTKTLKR